MKTFLSLIFFFTLFSSQASDTLRFDRICNGTDSMRTELYASKGIIKEVDPDTKEEFFFREKDETEFTGVILESGECSQNQGYYSFSDFTIVLRHFKEGKSISTKTFTITSKSHKYAHLSHYLRILEAFESGNMPPPLLKVFPGTSDAFAIFNSHRDERNRLIETNVNLNSTGDTTEYEVVMSTKPSTYVQETVDYRKGITSTRILIVNNGFLEDVQGDPIIFIDGMNQIISKGKYIELINETIEKQNLEKNLGEYIETLSEEDKATVLRMLFPANARIIHDSVYKKKIKKINPYKILMDQSVWRFEGDHEVEVIDPPYKSTQDIVIEQLKMDGKL